MGKNKVSKEKVEVLTAATGNNPDQLLQEVSCIMKISEQKRADKSPRIGQEA